VRRVASARRSAPAAQWLDLISAGGHFGVDGVRVAQADLAHRGPRRTPGAPARLSDGRQASAPCPARFARCRKRFAQVEKDEVAVVAAAVDQPIRTTCCPALAARSSPQRCVRSRLPKKSSNSRVLLLACRCGEVSRQFRARNFLIACQWRRVFTVRIRIGRSSSPRMTMRRAVLSAASKISSAEAAVAELDAQALAAQFARQGKRSGVHSFA